MKAYLVENPAPVPPFRKPASQIRFREGTLQARLRQQLAAAGFEVIDRDSPALDGIEPESLVIQDDVVISNGFLRRFLAALPNRAKNYQCEIDAGRFSPLSTKDAAPCFRLLPIRWIGNTAVADDGALAVPIAPLRMEPATILEVSQGLPARMHHTRDLRVYFSDYYAIQVQYWFEFQTASSLYCREFVSDLLRPLHGFFPTWLMQRVTSWSWLMERFNSVGRRTRIHPTAILEGCVVGDGVDIGPFAYLRSCVIADGAVIRERSSMKLAYVGEGGFIMGSDVVNSYVGAESAIITPMLYNVVFGERSFISGGSGFADFIVGSSSIVASIDGSNVASNLHFLGSAVGDDCFVGANLLFAPGRTIPDGTQLLDHGLIKSVPTSGGSFVLAGQRLVQIPDAFLAGDRR